MDRTMIRNIKMLQTI